MIQLCLFRLFHITSVSGAWEARFVAAHVGVGDMTKILYHDNNIHHNIVIFFILKRFLLY